MASHNELVVEAWIKAALESNAIKLKGNTIAGMATQNAQDDAEYLATLLKKTIENIEKTGS